MSETLEERILRHEGLMLKPYYCPAGKLSIGAGRNLDDVGITREEAMVLFANDVRAAKKAAALYSWFWQMNAARQDVIVEMIYNLGKNKFSRFERMIAALEQHDYAAAAMEMRDSVWAIQVKGRARELAQIMDCGFST